MSTNCPCRAASIAVPAVNAALSTWTSGLRSTWLRIWPAQASDRFLWGVLDTAVLPLQRCDGGIRPGLRAQRALFEPSAVGVAGPPWGLRSGSGCTGGE